MLFAIVPSVSNNAYANIFLIDNFTGDSGPQAGACDFSISMGSSPQFVQTGESEVIDMIRECLVKIQLEPLGMGPEAMITVDQIFPPGRFLQESGDGVRASVILTYDGEAMPANGRSLGLDLTESDKLRIDFTRADFDVIVKATLIDSGSDSATLTGLLPQGTNTLQMLNFLLTDFFLWICSTIF